VVVTLLDSNGDVADTNSANPQRLAENGSYRFTGLDAGTSYTVSLVRSAVVNTADCTDAVSDVEHGQRTMDSKVSALDTALAALTKALAAQSAGQGTTQGTSQGSTQGSTKGSTQGSTRGGSGSSSNRQQSGQSSGTGSTGGTGASGASTQATSGAQSGSQTGTPVTAEQLAADAKAIDAAKAELAVAHNDRSHATLTTPITGTVAAVDIAKGDDVSAGSSSQVVTVVGNGALTVELDISLADIDLVKAGQSAQVTVDGHTGTLPAKVTYVGQTNSGDSTGSSSTYTVTIQLTRTYPSLYDGMGADVAIDVGTVAGTLTVPVSAVHTSGSLHTVLVDSASGTVTRTPVTIGLVGDSLVQVKSGLKAGQKVVIADVSAAVPSSDTSSNSRGNRSGFGSFGTGGSGGPPGGR
jgi:RND family efflux transporter MFP subunit